MGGYIYLPRNVERQKELSEMETVVPSNIENRIKCS